MAHIITAVQAEKVDLIAPKTALISVSDKSGLIELASALVQQYKVALLSTGGTAKAIRDAGLPVTDVSDHTGSPEILDGRVKTLHPKIHGGLLGVRGNAKHESEMAANGVAPIDIVIVNLYAFEATVAKGSDFETCIENIDIGGPSMIRSAAKNHAAVTVVSSPDQYTELLATLAGTGGSTTHDLRRKFAAAAYARTAAYDSGIAAWFGTQIGSEASTFTRTYVRDVTLKYGCNPHQNPAFVGHLSSFANMPFDVLNGTPGYINFLDAANAWQLVSELRAATGLAAAASFKHVSPAGAAVAVPLSDATAKVYDIPVGTQLTPVALAYIRARNADPMCSFGDFAAVSDVVDEATAMVLKTEVSDGIVAPGYEPRALEILKSKKNGAFIVLQSRAGYTPPSMEFREVYGMAMAQRRNDVQLTPADLAKVVTAKGEEAGMPAEAIRDLLVALISIKYTQSNSVGYALEGQMVGVGAGQQSRVDCVKLAGRKVSTWWLRQHPKVQALPFKDDIKKQARVNARVRYIEGDFTPLEYAEWVGQFTAEPPKLLAEEKAAFMASLSGVALGSDAFFPFRDSLDHAAKFGVSYVGQPGGSVKDAEVTAAADEYGMMMVHGVPRLFHH